MSKIKLSCYYCGNEIGTGYNTSNIGFCSASCFADLILQAANKVEYQEEQADGAKLCGCNPPVRQYYMRCGICGCEIPPPPYSYPCAKCVGFHTDKNSACPKDTV